MYHVTMRMRSLHPGKACPKLSRINHKYLQNCDKLHDVVLVGDGHILDLNECSVQGSKF